MPLEHAIRLLIESIFCYFVYNYKSNNVNFRKGSIKEIGTFALVYVTLPLLYIHIFKDFYVVYRFISIIVMFAYLWTKDWLENKKVGKSNTNQWIYILTFSVFVSLMAECSHFISYVINRSFWQLLNIYDFRYINHVNLLLYFTMMLTLHSCFMFLTYKLHFIKMKDIKNISVHIQIPLLFILCLSTIIFIKYHYYQIGSNFYQDFFTWLLMFLLPTYLSFYLISCKLTRLKNIDQNYILDGVIETMVSIPIYCATINIRPLTYMYEKDKITFRKKLEKLGIDHGYKGYSQLVLSLIIISHFEGENLDFNENVFRHVSRFTGAEPKSIYDNIDSIIKKTWLQEMPENLKHWYKSVDNIENNPPTVQDFLIQMARKSA